MPRKKRSTFQDEYKITHSTRYPGTLYGFLWQDAGANLRHFNGHVVFILKEYALKNGYDPKKQYEIPQKFQRTPRGVKRAELMRRNKLLIETGYVDFAGDKGAVAPSSDFDNDPDDL